MTKMVKGKRKGNAFENLIYKDLRDSGIGQIQKSLASGATDEPADLLFSTRIGEQFVIECKHYKDMSIPKLDKIYQKTQTETMDWLTGQWTPTVIYRINYGPIMVYIKHAGIRCIMKYEDWKARLRGSIVLLSRLVSLLCSSVL